jgi:NitT/TauT family transport system permease protein/taurine transport system permease protein
MTDIGSPILADPRLPAGATAGSLAGASPPPTKPDGRKPSFFERVTHVRLPQRYARWGRTLSTLLVLAVALAVWQVLASLAVFPKVALPSPASVWHSFTSVATTGYLNKTLGQDVLYSVVRVTVGFVGAVVLGVPMGLLMAESRLVNRLVDPFLQLGRPVPPLAYIPLFVVWFVLGELPKILLILVGTIPIIIISTIGGVRNIPIQRYQVARCLGATRRQLFVRVTLPSTLPEVFTGMKVGIGIAWSTLVAAELIAASVGLGWLVEQAATQLQTGIVIAGIIVIGVLGYLMELGIRLLERVIVPWRGHV